MVVRKNDMRLESKTNMRGGEGTVTIRNMVEPEKIKNGRLMAEIILPPGAGIGEHTHTGETEYYIITEGSGVVCDEGTDVVVSTGDVVVTGDKESHSIRNNGKSSLKMYAVIITY